MGVVPLKGPPLFGTDEEKREQLRRYRDRLIVQRELGTGLPTWVWPFLILCWILTLWGVWKILWISL